MKEQRLYSRLDIKGTVILHLQDDTSHIITADLLNVGFLGMGISAKEKIEAGSNVKFELIADLSVEPIIGEGIIVYANEIKKNDTSIFRMGIKFIDINNKRIEHLLTLIHHDIISKLRKIKKK